MKRRQEYPKNFAFIDGSFYITNIDFLKKKKAFVVNGVQNIFSWK